MRHKVNRPSTANFVQKTEEKLPPQIIGFFLRNLFLGEGLTDSAQGTFAVEIAHVIWEKKCTPFY